MNNGAINKCASSVEAAAPFLKTGGEAASTPIEHIYVHIPFCARICPYCAFYKERADPSQTQRFCEAIVREIEQSAGPIFHSATNHLFRRRNTDRA